MSDNGNGQKPDDVIPVPENVQAAYHYEKPRFIQCRCGFTGHLPSHLATHLDNLREECEPQDGIDELTHVNIALAKLTHQLHIHRRGIEFCERESMAWSRIASFRSRRDKKRENEFLEVARPCCKCKRPTLDIFMGKHTCAEHFGGVAQMRLLEASLSDKDDE